jgi:DNA replication protein DnaC
MSKIELLSILKTLGIRSLMAGDLDDFIAQAEKETWTPLTLLEQFVKKELRERESRSLKLRQQESKIGAFTSMASFDWAWPKKIDRLLIESLLTAEFVESGDNVVLIGSHGLGKSLIAKNLIHQAVLKGHTALFVEASQMLTDLSSKDSARILEQRLKHYTRPDLLCIDEVGYLSYDQRAADFLFQIISRRYEKKSVIITTNLAFND